MNDFGNFLFMEVSPKLQRVPSEHFHDKHCMMLDAIFCPIKLVINFVFIDDLK